MKIILTFAERRLLKLFKQNLRKLLTQQDHKLKRDYRLRSSEPESCALNDQLNLHVDEIML